MVEQPDGLELDKQLSSKVTELTVQTFRIDSDEEQIRLAEQAIELAEGKWDKLTGDGKSNLISCFFSAGLIHGNSNHNQSVALDYHDRAIALAEDDWQQLDTGGKSTIIVCFGHTGVDSNKLNHNQSVALDYYDRAIVLAEDDWAQLQTEGKNNLISCFRNAGAVSNQLNNNPDKALDYYDRAIALAENDWAQLDTGGKSKLIGCFLNAGLIHGNSNNNPAKALDYYDRVIALAEDKWAQLNTDGKGDLVDCFFNAGIASNQLNNNPAKVLDYYDRAIELSIADWFEFQVNSNEIFIQNILFSRMATHFNHQLNQKTRSYLVMLWVHQLLPLQAFAQSDNAIGCKRLVNFCLHNRTPSQTLLKASIDLSHYLLVDLNGVDVDWLFPQYVDLLALLADGLLALHWHSPTALIQDLQQLTHHLAEHNTATDSVSPASATQPDQKLTAISTAYSHYLIDTYEWHSHIIDSTPDILMRLIAQKDTNNLDWLTKLYDCWQRQTQEHANLPLKQRLNEQLKVFDLKHHLGLLVMPKQISHSLRISHFFKSANLSISELLNTKAESQAWLARCVTDFLGLLADSLSGVMYWDEIDELSQFLIHLIGADNTPNKVELWHAWLTGTVPELLKDAVKQCTDEGVAGIERLRAHLPPPTANLTLLKSLNHCQQYLLPHYIEQGDVKAVWRSLELSRLAINARYITDIDSGRKDRFMSNTVVAQSVAKAVDSQQTSLYHYLDSEDDTLLKQTDAFGVFRALAKGFDKHDIRLPVVTPEAVQTVLADDQALVQIWHRQHDRGNADDTQPQLSVHLLLLTKTDIQLHTLIDADNVDDDASKDLSKHLHVWRDAWLDPNATDTATSIAQYTQISHLVDELLSCIAQQLECMVENQADKTPKVTMPNQVILIPDDLLATLPWLYHPSLDAKQTDKDVINAPPHDLQLAVSVSSWYEHQAKAKLSKTAPKLNQTHTYIMQHVLQPALDDNPERNDDNVITAKVARTEQTMLDDFTHLLPNAVQNQSKQIQQPIELLQALSHYQRHHFIGHGRYDANDPANSLILVNQRTSSKSPSNELPAWQLAFADVQGEVSLSICQALSYGTTNSVSPSSNSQSKHTDKVTGHMGAIGIGVSMVSADVIVGSSIQIDSLSSWFFNYYYHQYRWQHDSINSVRYSQQKLRTLTFAEAKQVVTAGGYADLLDVLEHDYAGMSYERCLFADPFFWSRYTVFGNAPRCEYTFRQMVYLWWVLWSARVKDWVVRVKGWFSSSG